MFSPTDRKMPFFSFGNRKRQIAKLHVTLQYFTVVALKHIALTLTSPQEANNQWLSRFICIDMLWKAPYVNAQTSTEAGGTHHELISLNHSESGISVCIVWDKVNKNEFLFLSKAKSTYLGRRTWQLQRCQSWGWHSTDARGQWPAPLRRVPRGPRECHGRFHLF